MQIINEIKIEKILSKKLKDSELSFRCYSHNSDEDQEIWTHKIIELYKNMQPVGYIKLIFYDRNQMKSPINNVLDYFAIIKSNQNPEPWTKRKNIEFFNQFKFLNPVDYIKQRYTNEYKEFMSLWDNKPTVEIVRIYDETDKRFAKHNEIPPNFKKRDEINFKQQGLGKALYLAAALWMKEENKSVYSSLKQTENGQNMWKSIQKNPQFILSCETIAKKLNGKSIEIIRNSISMK